MLLLVKNNNRGKGKTYFQVARCPPKLGVMFTCFGGDKYDCIQKRLQTQTGNDGAVQLRQWTFSKN